MPQPYSGDLRERVVTAAASQTQAEVAARFAVSESTVYKWCRRARETGSAAAKPHTGGARPKVDAAGAAVLRALVAERNDRTLTELADPIYNGSPASWQRFANTLHARMALRIINVDPTAAAAELQKALTGPGGVFRSNADNAVMRWPGDGAFNNPWSDNFKGRDDHRMSRTLMDIMLANSDPRVAVYAQPTVSDPTKYAGMPNGLSATQAGTWCNTSSRVGAVFFPGATAYGNYGGGGASFPQHVLTYAELQFIRAEAAERGIAGLLPGQAAGFYNDAITASLNQWGITIPADIAAFLARPNVAYKGGVEGLKQIAVQKWIALFTDGGQAWAEWCRTCQPTTLVPGPAALTTYIPRRFRYSTTEVSANSENLSAAIARQGADNFATRVYWDTKPTAAPTCS